MKVPAAGSPSADEAPSRTGMIENAIQSALVLFLGGSILASAWVATLGLATEPRRPVTEPLEQILANLHAGAIVLIGLQYLGLAAVAAGVIRYGIHQVRARRRKSVAGHQQ